MGAGEASMFFYKKKRSVQQIMEKPCSAPYEKNLSEILLPFCFTRYILEIPIYKFPLFPTRFNINLFVNDQEKLKTFFNSSFASYRFIGKTPSTSPPPPPHNHRSGLRRGKCRGLDLFFIIQRKNIIFIAKD